MTCPFSHFGLKTSASKAEVKASYRKLAMKAHPDRGGSHEGFVELKRQYELALKMVGRNTETRTMKQKCKEAEQTRSTNTEKTIADAWIRVNKHRFKYHPEMECDACNGLGKIGVSYGVYSLMIRCPICKGAKAK